MSAREHLDAMKAQYAAGDSLQDIGDRYGITRERVRQLFKRAGVEMRRPQESLSLHPERRSKALAAFARHRAERTGKTKAVLEQAAEMVRAGATYRETARALGITPSQVAGVCFRLKVSSGRPSNRRNIDWLPLLHSARERGLCPSHLALEIGCSAQAAICAAKKYGIDLPHGVKGRPVGDRSYAAAVKAKALSA